MFRLTEYMIFLAFICIYACKKKEMRNDTEVYNA